MMLTYSRFESAISNVVVVEVGCGVKCGNASTSSSAEQTGKDQPGSYLIVMCRPQLVLMRYG